MSEINRGELEKMMNTLTTYELRNGRTIVTSSIMNELRDMFKEARYKLFKNFEYDVKSMLTKYFRSNTSDPLYVALHDAVFESVSYDSSREV